MPSSREHKTVTEIAAEGNPAVSSLARSGEQRVRELDGIRGLAILLILVWHYVVCRFTPPSGSLLALFWPLLALTWSGVDLFFVLSGFLIGGILLQQRDSPNYFRTFYARRVCRIMPLYFLVLSAVWVAMQAGLAEQSQAWSWLLSNSIPFWSYVLFLQNFFMLDHGDFGASALAVTWSLAIEEQFYLLFPWLVRCVPRRRLPYILLVCICLAPICRILFYRYHHIPPAGGFFLMPSRLDALGLGALAAYGIHSEQFMALVRKYPRSLYLLFVVLLAGCVLLCWLTPGIISAPITYWGHSWLALFFVTLIVLALVQRDGLLAAFLRTHWLGRLGVISYGVYLLHLPVIGLLDALLIHRKWQSDPGLHVVFVVIALVLTIFGAAILYRFVEKPLIQWGHRFRY